MNPLRLFLALLLLGRPLARPRMDSSTIACIVEWKAGGACIDATTTPPPTAAFIDRGVEVFNYNIDRCDMNPDPGHSSAFKLPLPLNPRTLQLDCNLGPGMDMSTSCNLDALNKVALECVKAFDRKDSAINVIVFNFPVKTCPWAGMGSQGGAWTHPGMSVLYFHSDIKGFTGSQLAALMLHEVGHDWGFGHAATVSSWDEGDFSCQMGGANGPDSGFSCFMAANANAIGFSTSLVAPLVPDGSNVWRTFTVPVASTAFRNHLVIEPSVARADMVAVFLSVRSARGRPGVVDNSTANLGYLAGGSTNAAKVLIPAGGVEGKLAVHQSRGRNQMTTLLDVLAPSPTAVWDSSAQIGDLWSGNPFALRHVAYTQGVASTVLVCFYSGASPANCKSGEKLMSSTVEGFEAEADNRCEYGALRNRRSWSRAMQFSPFFL